VSSITTARTDPWHCPGCGAGYDLAPLSAEVGLVRLAVAGGSAFALGSAGIEREVAALLRPCSCGAGLEPGRGGSADPPARAQFDPQALLPVACAGWSALESSDDPRLAQLGRVWRPRAFRAMGREAELTREELLELKLEGRLQDLLDEAQRASAAGDQEAAEAAHARYVELGTAYVQRFVRGRERPADAR
jgi:hypothetical protein